MTRCSVSAIILASVFAATASAQIAPSPAGAPLSLDAAVQLSLAHNRQVQTASLDVERAEDDLAVARMKRLPIFETEVKASQLLTPVDFAFPAGAFGTFPGTGPIPATDTNVSVPRQPTYYLSAQVSQPLTQLFRINLSVRAAAATRDLERTRVRAQQLATIHSVKQLYFAILQTRSALAATDENITLYRELDRTLQVRVAQQVALRGDSLDVQFRLAQEELTRTTYTNTLASQKEQLNQLLGRDVRTAFEVEEAAGISALEVDLTAAQRRALDTRPDLQEARLTMAQAEIDRRIKKAERIPDVSLAVGYTANYNIDVLPKNLATVGVQMTWEPFDWGRKSRELSAKGHRVEQTRLAVRELEDKAVVEINSAWRTLTEKRASLQVMSMAQATAREKLRVITNRYQIQSALLPDVLQLRADLAETHDRYQQALLGFWTAKASFEQAIGEDVIP